MSTLYRELRYSFRRLFKNPGSSAGAVLTMALGIGLTVSMFSIIDGAVLRGLPFEESDRLLHLSCSDFAHGVTTMGVSPHDFEDWRAQQQSFEGLAGLSPTTVNLSDELLPERYLGERVSASFLELLRVRPILGRGFQAADEAPGAPTVLLIGYHVWQQRYGSDPDIVGRTVRVNSEPATVVGVLPRGFRFPFRHDVWLPLKLETSEVRRGEGRRFGVFGRLKDGVSAERAAAEMAEVARRLEEQYPQWNRGIGVTVKPYVEAFIDKRAQLLLGVMFTAVLLVLLIACLNVANLLIVRASSRSHELAIRSALGAGRARTLGQVLGEAGLLTAGGVLIGVLLARFAVGALSAAIADMDPPFWVKFQVDGRVLLFAVAVTVAAALAAGLMPAWQASNPNLNQVLQDATRGSSSFRMGWLSRMMAVLQLAVSLPLLIGAALLVRTVVRINDYDLHLDPDHVLTARVTLFEGDHPEAEDWITFFRQLRSRLADEPGVVSAGIGTVVPTDMTDLATIRFRSSGASYNQPEDLPAARLAMVSPGYFETLGVALRTGRDLTGADRQGASAVAVVSEALAERQWPEQSPIGQRIRLWWGAEKEPEDPDAGWSEVVGVVPNLHFGDFDNPADAPAIYLPLAQSPQRSAWIVVRTSQDPAAFVETLRRTVRELDPNLPLYHVRSMDQVVARAMFFPILLGVMFSVFGAGAVILAAVGLYGVIAFGVARRTREVGMRMAFGATRRDVLTLVLKQGLLQASVGLLLGLVLAAPLAKALGGFLFRMEPADPWAFTLIPLLLLLIAVAACLVPARRAVSVDPIEVLRYE